MRKWVIAGIVAVALFAIGAFAASFSFSAEDVASGQDPVNSCATSASVQWHTTPTNTSPPVFQTDTALVKTTAAAGASCATRPYRLAIKVGAGSPVLCSGTLDATGAATVTLSSCATPAGPYNVADVTGAALLIGDATFALQAP
jgi:hypothetical protein